MREAGIAFEIVPGVTAALGRRRSPAFRSRIAPRQRRRFPDRTRNARQAESALDWPLLARFPGTLVIYMGMSRLALIAQQLIEHGRIRPRRRVVQYASSGDQRTVEGPLSELPALVRPVRSRPRRSSSSGPSSPSADSWHGSNRSPLFGKRILVTRPRHQAGELVDRLIELGRRAAAFTRRRNSFRRPTGRPLMLPSLS